MAKAVITYNVQCDCGWESEQEFLSVEGALRAWAKHNREEHRKVKQ